MMRLFALYFLFPLAARADDCPPATWQAKGSEGASNPKIPKRPRSTLVTTADKKIQPGDVNCRYSATTGATVNYHTCAQLATKYGTAFDHFFTLNPTLELDCSNIQPKTEYCVDGFIEPLRATDGRCGPPNRNATCLGMPHGQCCNSETWTCGKSTEDCARGTCYEGICFGDKIYSTDGTCGPDHGDRLCAGKWGDCCNQDGACGTGDDFCGPSVCFSGKCTILDTEPTPPDGMKRNTPDGTCGGENGYICKAPWGTCCNQNGICGIRARDCGAGW
ncbi:hypothetical protein F5144DRAFT_374761 [Chaetomium tenue]|uniref:Uncharacterized protein n=1 Tax=Chaetomium tenue TaxID=1854479 RepID=A0ACB7P039_9PEZI|nr:hypothetical protein F5144DRAFT_374761 [Chaetomium globosum]